MLPTSLELRFVKFHPSINSKLFKLGKWLFLHNDSMTYLADEEVTEKGWYLKGHRGLEWLKKNKKYIYKILTLQIHLSPRRTEYPFEYF